MLIAATRGVRPSTAASAELLDEGGIDNTLQADELRLDACGLQCADDNAAGEALADRQDDVARARRDLLENLEETAASVRARLSSEVAARQRQVQSSSEAATCLSRSS